MAGTDCRRESLSRDRRYSRTISGGLQRLDEAGVDPGQQEPQPKKVPIHTITPKWPLVSSHSFHSHAVSPPSSRGSRGSQNFDGGSSTDSDTPSVPYDLRKLPVNDSFSTHFGVIDDSCATPPQVQPVGRVYQPEDFYSPTNSFIAWHARQQARADAMVYKKGIMAKFGGLLADVFVCRRVNRQRAMVLFGVINFVLFAFSVICILSMHSEKTGVGEKILIQVGVWFGGYAAWCIVVVAVGFLIESITNWLCCDSDAGDCGSTVGENGPGGIPEAVVIQR